MALVRIKSVKDYDREVKKNPNIIYNSDPDCYRKKNNISWNNAHDFFAAHIKYNKNLYNFASKEGEKFHKNLTHLSILIGWGINLFTIIISSYKNDVSKDLVTTLNSLGNLLSVIVITIVNFYSLQEKNIVFRRYGHDLDELQNSIEFFSSSIQAENKTIQEIKDSYKIFYTKYLNLKTKISFPISQRTQDKFYRGMGFTTLLQVYEELFSSFSYELINYNDENKNENSITIQENETKNKEN